MTFLLLSGMLNAFYIVAKLRHLHGTLNAAHIVNIKLNADLCTGRINITMITKRWIDF